MSRHFDAKTVSTPPPPVKIDMIENCARDAEFGIDERQQEQPGARQGFPKFDHRGPRHAGHDALWAVNLTDAPAPDLVHFVSNAGCAANPSTATATA